ncbi:MAG: hypothetical protein ACYTKD_08800 [Planctomycetota bacterium]
MPDNETEQTPRAFRWNAGGWFGGQLGATLWIALLGVLLLFDAPRLGALIVAFALAPNVLGVVLWRMRDRIRVYPALQLLIAVAGAFALFAFVSLDVAGRISALRAGEERSVYWVLLIYPGMMLMFHVKHRAARGRGSGGGEDDKEDGR